MTLAGKSKWTGKTALICGGSQGFGLDLARRLCRENVGRLILVARGEAKLQAAVELLRAEQPLACTELHIFAADICNSQATQELVEKLQALPAIDLMIQAVGMSDRGRLQDLEVDHALRLFEVNVISSLNVVRWMPEKMARPSTMILIGSLASHFAPRYLGGYAIAKHALAALAQQSRLELAEQQIHVMLASPGPIARPDAGQRYGNKQTAGLPSAALQPGGGANVKGLDPSRLAEDILRAAARRKLSVIYPGMARLLAILSAISPWLGDRILRRKTT